MNKIRNSAAISFLSLTLIFFSASAVAENTEATVLEGTWIQISGTVDGKQQSSRAIESSHISFFGNTFQHFSFGERSAGLARIQGTSTRGYVDLVFNEGKPAGKTTYGIYQIKNDVFHISILKEKSVGNLPPEIGTCNCSAELQFRRQSSLQSPQQHGNSKKILAPSVGGDMLIQAIEENDEAKVDRLLKDKVSPNARGYKNEFMSPLELAVKNNNKDLANKLIEHGADINEVGVMTFAIPHADMLELVIAHGANVNEPKGFGSPLHHAIDSEQLDSAKVLLDHGADINDQDTMFKRTTLHYAAQYGKERSVKWLIEQGADVNLVDARGQTPLVVGASYKANVRILKMLIEHGAKLSEEDIPQITTGACHAGNTDALVFLKELKVDIDFNACYKAISKNSSNQDMLRWLDEHNVGN